MKTKKKQAILFTSQSGLDIKDILLRLNSKIARKAAIVSAEDDGVGDLIRTSSISKLLLDAIDSQYKDRIASISDLDEDILFVHCHPCFWKKGAAFTAIDKLIGPLSEAVDVKCIITLIDDFYNVYFRICDYYQSRSVRDPVNPLELLYWRAVDTMLAHMVANQLSVSHYVISVNHPMNLLTRLLFSPHVSIYAGHPITDAREGRGPAESRRIIQRINKEFLVPLSKTPSIVEFIPDTIDETPIFGKDSEPPKSYTELQSAIWPREWISHEEPIGRPPELSICKTLYDDIVKSISKNHETYSVAVGGQISDRDYRLVNQSKNFMFSLFNEVPSSDGVEAELVQARYGLKGIYFFNPDGIKRAKSGSQNKPGWATNLTGEDNSLKQLAKTVGSKLEPPFIKVT